MIILIICLIMAAISKGLKDAIAHEKALPFFMMRDFWNNKFSWRFKYKDGIKENGARFFGSTTFLVWLTDGWHLIQKIMFSFIFFPYSYENANGFWNVLILFSSIAIGFGIVFEGAYRLWCGEALITFKESLYMLLAFNTTLLGFIIYDTTTGLVPIWVCAIFVLVCSGTYYLTINKLKQIK